MTNIQVPAPIEEKIQELIKQECRRRKSSLWGQECEIEPRLVSEIIGDGVHVVYLQTLDCRPDYYVLRIDSKMNIDDSFDPEILLEAIEEEFGNAADYNEDYISGEYKVRRWDADDNEPWEDATVIDFPVLSTGNGYSWGTIKNFSNELPQPPQQ